MERLAMFQYGPRFFEQDGTAMFEFRVDAGNVIGPRKATSDDLKKHAKVWDAFVASKTAEPVEETAEVPAEAPAPRRGRPPKVK